MHLCSVCVEIWGVGWGKGSWEGLVSAALGCGFLGSNASLFLSAAIAIGPAVNHICDS